MVFLLIRVRRRKPSFKLPELSAEEVLLPHPLGPPNGKQQLCTKNKQTMQKNLSTGTCANYVQNKANGKHLHLCRSLPRYALALSKPEGT